MSKAPENTPENREKLAWFRTERMDVKTLQAVVADMLQRDYEDPGVFAEEWLDFMES